MDIAIEFLVEKELQRLADTVEKMQGDREEGADDAKAVRSILYTIMGALKSGHLVPLSNITAEFSRQLVGFLQEARVVTIAEDATLDAEVIQ